MTRHLGSRALWVSWALMAIVLAAALFAGTRDTRFSHTNQDRVFDISATLKCPKCVGQSVADSDVQISREIRAEIARGVEAGKSDDQIRAELIASYGDDIDYTPPASGVAGLVWVLPVAGAVAAIAGLVVVFRRWQREAASLHATDDDRELVGQALAERHDREATAGSDGL